MRFSSAQAFHDEPRIHFTSYREADKFQGPGLWDFKLLKRFYEGLGVNYDKLYSQIRDIIIKTLISTESGIQSEINKN